MCIAITIDSDISLPYNNTNVKIKLFLYIKQS